MAQLHRPDAYTCSQRRNTVTKLCVTKSRILEQEHDILESMRPKKSLKVLSAD